MGTEIQEKFDRFHKREKVIRRVSVLTAIVPFIIGLVWIYYAYEKVGKMNTEYQEILEKSKKEEVRYHTLLERNQKLELKLNYGLSIENDSMIANKSDVMLTSDSANIAINILKLTSAPDTNIVITYYLKSSESEKITLAIKSLGYYFTTKSPSERMTNQVTNCIWFGKNVSVNDSKVVALAMVRAGIKIKAIRPFRNSTNNPAYKKNIIEIGGDRNLESSNVSPLPVAYIKNATAFTR